MKLSLDLENCYGINKLEQELDFTRGMVLRAYAHCMRLMEH